MTSCSKKRTQEIKPSYTIVGAFCPFPTIKIPAITDNIPRIIYAAAENLFRSYPVDVPLLIYQCHHHTGYDVFIERTHHGWKEWVNTYSIPFQKKSIYMVDGLELALQQEKEMSSILPAMIHHVKMLYQTLEIECSCA
jgi:hypothetical protein